MKISIIIPTYSEGQLIAPLVKYLFKHGQPFLKEIIVANFGNDDDTITTLKNSKAIILQCKQKGRAFQLNEGAALATGDILYFVHADSMPPTTYGADIIDNLQKGYNCGRYKTKFDRKSVGLSFNAFFTNFDLFVCYGGDQTFYITRQLFDKINGYDESYKIMEDYNITIRAKKQGRYCIMQNTCLINTRKYDTASWWQVMMANKKMISMYRSAANQDAMVETYKKMLAKK